MTKSRFDLRLLTAALLATVTGFPLAASAQTIVTADSKLPPENAGVVIQNGATVTGSDVDVTNGPNRTAVAVQNGNLTLTDGAINQFTDDGFSAIGLQVQQGSANLSGTAIDIRGGRDSSGLNTLGVGAEIVADGITINVATTGQANSAEPTAAVKADGGSISISNSSITSTGTRGYGLLSSSNGAETSIVSTNNTISTNGERAFGAYAFGNNTPNVSGGLLSISGGSIATDGLNAWGLLAFGQNASISTSNGLAVQTAGANGFGAYVGDGGTINLQDTRISTTGVGAFGVNVQAGSSVSATGGSVSSAQSAGVALFNSGSASFTGTTISAGAESFLSSLSVAGASQSIALTDGSVATQNNGTLLRVARTGAAGDGVVDLTLGAGSTSTGDIVDTDALTSGGTDVTVEEGASWTGTLQGVRNFFGFAGGDVTYEGRPEIAGDLTGNGTNYTFSSEGADIGGNVSLNQGSRTTGGSVGSPITVGQNVSVDQSSFMGGNWAIAGDLDNAGTISPGNSIGRVSVGGDLNLAPTSVYAVEIDGTGNADRVDVAGTANLAGSVTVTPLGGFLVNQPYTILTAGTRAGTFDSVSFSQNLAFLNAGLSYDPNNVFVTIQRNGVSFASAATTANQAATANAIDTLSLANPLASVIAFSSVSNAQAAFDQLSGEVHASVRGALVDGSRHVRDAVSSRVEDAFGVIAQGADVVVAAEDPRFLSSGLWVSGFGSWGEADGNGNAAEAERDTGGVFVGGDMAVAPNATIGLFGGYSNTSVDVDARNSSADIDSFHVGAYGAAAYGAVELSAGAAYTWNDVDTSRSVIFPGFTDTLTAGYDADVTQVFGEVGYRMSLGGVALKPFAGLAYVYLDGDSFGESGGAASLLSSSDSSDTTFTTLGVRASYDMRVAGYDLAARGMVGWRHATGDRTPTAVNAFQTGAAFTVAGAPVSRDAAVIEAGFSTEIAPNTSLSLDYIGLFGDDTTDNGVRAALAFRF